MKDLRVKGANRKWWILAAMTGCSSMIFTDQTVLPIALPTIQKELLLTDLSLQWIINAYLLGLSTLVLMGGYISDYFGHRRFFCIGVTIFALSSASCSLAFSGWWLIGSRAVQGIGAAFMLPSTLSIIMDTFPVNQRGRAMGIYIGVWSLFLSLGPFIGGAFTQFLSWRWIFWINLPIAFISLSLALMALNRSQQHKIAFDYLGFLCLFCGLTTFIIALMQGKVWGWDSSLIIILFILSFLFLMSLFFIEINKKHPFFNFQLFKNRQFTGCNIILFLTQTVLMLTVFWAIFFQVILKYPPFIAGLFMVISTLPLLFIAPLAGFCLDRFGPKTPILCGLICVLFTFLWFIFVAHTSSILYFLPGLLTFGSGIGLTLSPASVTALSSSGHHRRGSVYGVMATIRQVGGTIGMALFGSLLLTLQSMRFFHLLKKSAVQVSSQEMLILDKILSGSHYLWSQLNHYSHFSITLLQQMMHDAYLFTFVWMNVVGACLTLIALITAFVTLQPQVLSEPADY